MKVRLLSPANDEIVDAALWLDSQRRGLGNEFWREVDGVLSQIAANPLQYATSEFATAEFEMRAALVARFKYVIHFLIDGDEVQVLAVAHSARKPGYWLRRSNG